MCPIVDCFKSCLSVLRRSSMRRKYLKRTSSCLLPMMLMKWRESRKGSWGFGASTQVMHFTTFLRRNLEVWFLLQEHFHQWTFFKLNFKLTSVWSLRMIMSYLKSKHFLELWSVVWEMSALTLLTKIGKMKLFYWT